MGFFARLFSSNESTKHDVCPICYRDCSGESTKNTGLCESCSRMIRTASFPDYPIETEDRKISDIWLVTLSGLTHAHNGSDPQITLKKTPCGSRVYFVPDKQNQNDPYALKAFSIDDKYIGWYPRSDSRLQQKLYSRIANKEPYWAVISDIYRKGNNDFLFCEVKIFTFENEEEKAIRLQKLEEQRQKTEKMVSDQINYIESRRAHIPEELKPYFSICLDSIKRSHLPPHFLDYSVENAFFTINFGYSPILKLKLGGRLHYILISESYLSHTTLPNTILVTLGTASDGRGMMRVFLNSPSELEYFSDYIAGEYHHELETFKRLHHITQMNIKD